MTTTMKLQKRGGAYVLAGSGDPSAALETGRAMRRGTITVDGETLPVEVNDRWRSGVTVVRGGSPVLRLDPAQSYVPGSREPVQWSATRGFGGYVATLARGRDLIELRLPRMHGKAVEVSVAGAWAQLELVVLAGCFAVLARRRADAMRAAVIAGATGHGH